MLKKYVQVLIHEQFVLVPPDAHQIPVALIDDATEAGARLIDFWSQLSCQRSLCREGEDEPDYGLVDTRGVPGKDLKFFLHVPFDLREMIAREPELHRALVPYQREIDKLLLLHSLLNKFNSQLFAEIADALPEISSLQSMAADFTHSYQHSVPGATTVLRGLLYPAMPKQSGAQPHFDIDCATTHLGDLGGELKAHRTLGSDEGECISPPLGFLAAFFGLKAFVTSRGRLVPLWHSATSNPGEDRRAFVQFNHITTNPPVNPGDGKEFDHLFQAVGIDNPETWYAERMQL